MGVKDFTKLFKYDKEVKLKDLNGGTVVVDAMMELYRCALGGKHINQLTNKEGKPTMHIRSLLLGVIFKLQQNNIRQFWVFDCSVENHNTMKEIELQKRRQRRDDAKQEIMDMVEHNVVFSDDDNDIITDAPIYKKEKEAFVLKDFYIDDLLIILNALDIPWMQAPPGYEAEQICAYLTHTIADYVLTSDADALVFGAKAIIKRNTRTKKLYLYVLKNILTSNKITYNEFIDIALMMGTDFAYKTKGIGAGTILKPLSKKKAISLGFKEGTLKFKTVVLSEEQEKAKYEVFNKPVNYGVWYNYDTYNPFMNKEKINELISWLVEVNDYNKDIIMKSFSFLLK